MTPAIAQQQTVKDITKNLIEPLSDETRKLFKPIKHQSNYTLRVRLDKDNKHFICSTYYQNRLTGEFKKASQFAAQEFFERIPQRKFLQKTEEWHIAGTDFNAILINALWEPHQLNLSDEAAVLYQYLLMRFYNQTVCAKRVADYKLNGILPEMPEDWIDHPDWPLLPYQRVAFINSLNNESYGLFMKQGTGKTPPVISRICYEARQLQKKEQRLYRALIVAPKNVCRGWQRKFHQFAVEPGLVTILRGSQLQRVKLLVEALKANGNSIYTVIVCSYETLQRSWEALRLLCPDLCILDESHWIKSHHTKRWKKAEELRDLCRQRQDLTGTLTTNYVFDVFTQFEFLGEGLSGFTNYKAFKSYYGKFVKPEESRFEKLVDYKNLPLLQERLSRLGFNLSKEEALPDLPKKYYDVIDVSMSESQYKYYKQLQEMLAIEIENEIASSENKQLTAGHVLTKLLRLSQITCGYLVWDKQFDENGECTNIDSIKERIADNPKLNAVIEELQKKDDTDKTIIYTNWVECIKMLSDALTVHGIKHVVYYGDTNDKDREIAETSYNNDPSVKVFLGNPAACKEGMDLHGFNVETAGTPEDHGCNTTHEIYYSQNWSMVAREQSEDRPHRAITRVPIRVSDVIVPNSIDEEIYEIVFNKRIDAENFQNIKDIMSRVLHSIPDVGDDDDI